MFTERLGMPLSIPKNSVTVFVDKIEAQRSASQQWVSKIWQGALKCRTGKQLLSRARRVARGNYSPPALTEPDLWFSHPALRDNGVGVCYCDLRLPLFHYR